MGGGTTDVGPIRNLGQYGDFFANLDWKQIIFPGSKVLEIGCGSGFSLFKGGPRGMNILSLVGTQGQVLASDHDPLAAESTYNFGLKEYNKSYISLIHESDIKNSKDIISELQKKQCVIYASGENPKGYPANFFDVCISFYALYTGHTKSMLAIKNMLKATKPGGVAYLYFPPDDWSNWSFRFIYRNPYDFLKFLKKKGFEVEFAGHGLILKKPKLDKIQAKKLNKELDVVFSKIKIKNPI